MAQPVPPSWDYQLIWSVYSRQCFLGTMLCSNHNRHQPKLLVGHLTSLNIHCTHRWRVYDAIYSSTSYLVGWVLLTSGVCLGFCWGYVGVVKWAHQWVVDRCACTYVYTLCMDVYIVYSCIQLYNVCTHIIDSLQVSKVMIKGGGGFYCGAARKGVVSGATSWLAQGPYIM